MNENCSSNCCGGDPRSLGRHGGFVRVLRSLALNERSDRRAARGHEATSEGEPE